MNRKAVVALVVVGVLGATLGLLVGRGHSIMTIDAASLHGPRTARDVIAPFVEAAQIEVNSFEGLDRVVEGNAAVIALQTQLAQQLAGGTTWTESGDDGNVVHVDRDRLSEQGDRVRESVKSWLGSLTGSGDVPRFGVTVATATTPRGDLDTLPPGSERAVLLVHGLDEPGWIWRDLVPALEEADHIALRFEYPNDQAVADSADLLAEHLEALRSRGIEQVDVVAHSMGGLVTRDVLTRPEIMNGDGGGGDHYPAIDRLIMLGTPNGGSEMARLRCFIELREQVVRWFSGTGAWNTAQTDGAGEAGVDLTPGSTFLENLNARPLATHTTYTIIAGRASPVGEADVTELVGKARDLVDDASAPKWVRDWFAEEREAKLRRTVRGAVDGIGDGVVTIESARLEGVEDFNIVEADHVGMIVNVFKDKGEVPPGLPIVLERLGDGP